MLYDLVKNGEYVSEFSEEEVCYFLQRFGGAPYLNFYFEPKFYGPYSSKVRFLLNVLNGSYLMGFMDMSKRPFDRLALVADGLEDVEGYIHDRPELKAIGDTTRQFLTGFYSDFALELLSSVDYIAQHKQTFEKAAIQQGLNELSNRKRSMPLNDQYLDIVLDHLRSNKLDNRTILAS